jgi:hypothetical protein
VGAPQPAQTLTPFMTRIRVTEAFTWLNGSAPLLTASPSATSAGCNRRVDDHHVGAGFEGHKRRRGLGVAGAAENVCRNITQAVSVNQFV